MRNKADQTRYETITRIETQMAETINSYLGTKIEVTMRGETAWTITGTEAHDVRRAAGFLEENLPLTTENIEAFEGEHYAFLTGRIEAQQAGRQAAATA